MHLTATAPTGVDDVGNERREHTLRLLGDRLGVLGGELTTTSSVHITEITCTVPLAIEPGEPLDHPARTREQVPVGVEHPLR